MFERYHCNSVVKWELTDPDHFNLWARAVLPIQTRRLLAFMPHLHTAFVQMTSLRPCPDVSCGSCIQDNHFVLKNIRILAGFLDDTPGL